jgi:hypothetical protein
MRDNPFLPSTVASVVRIYSGLLLTMNNEAHLVLEIAKTVIELTTNLIEISVNIVA